MRLSINEGKAVEVINAVTSLKGGIRDNVTLGDVYEGRRNEILDQRAVVKARTMTKGKIHNLRLAG